ADDRLVEPTDGLPRALPRALRQALHRAPDRAEPVRRALGSRRAEAALPGTARGPAPRRGGPDPRARGRRQLGDPARRGTPPATAKAPAAGLSRREHAAPRLADGGAGRGRGSRLAARRGVPVTSAPAAADARDHPARRVRARARGAARVAARAVEGNPGLRGQSAIAAAVRAAAARRPPADGFLRSGPRARRRVDIRADRGAPRGGLAGRRRPQPAAGGPPR